MKMDNNIQMETIFDGSGQENGLFGKLLSAGKVLTESLL
jgi:hypothetical protein